MIAHGRLARFTTTGPKALTDSPAPLILLLGLALAGIAGAAMCGGTALKLAGAVVGMATLLVAVWRPFWIVCCFFAVFPFVPVEGAIFGFYAPNKFQVFIGLLAVGTFATVMRQRGSSSILLRTADVFLWGFLVIGWMGLALNHGKFLPGYFLWSIPGIAMFYFFARLVPMDQQQLDTLVRVTMISAGLCAILVLHEAVTQSSAIYSLGEERLQGRYVPVGPFGAHYVAASFLAMWPPFCLYGMLRSKNRLWWAVSVICLVLTAAATFRTLERAQTAGMIFGVLACLCHRGLRAQGMRLSIVAVPVAILASGFLLGPFMTRFQKRESTAESRADLRQKAWDTIGSDRWNPVYGTGYFTGVDVQYGGGRQTRARVHNFPLQLVMEFGAAGAFLFSAMMLCFGLEWVRLFREARRANGDTSFLMMVLGVTVTTAVIASFHNIFTCENNMVVWWWLVGLVMGQGGLVAGVTSASGARARPVAA